MNNDIPPDWSTRHANRVLGIIIRWLAGSDPRISTGPEAHFECLKVICMQQVATGDLRGAQHTALTLAELDREVRLAAITAPAPNQRPPAPEPVERTTGRKAPPRRRTLH